MIVENTKKKPTLSNIMLLLRKQVSRSEHSSTFNPHARLSKESTTNSFKPWAGLSNLPGEHTLCCCCSEHQMHIFQSHHSSSLWSGCYFLHLGSLCLIHLCCKKQVLSCFSLGRPGCVFLSQEVEGERTAPRQQGY